MFVICYTNTKISASAGWISLHEVLTICHAWRSKWQVHTYIWFLLITKARG